MYEIYFTYIYSGTPLNRNLSKLEFPPTKQMSKSRIFSFYLHCIKIPANRNPSIPETGQALYYF